MTAKTGASARTKGATAEREVIKLLSGYLIRNMGNSAPTLVRNTSQTQNGGSDIVVKHGNGTHSTDVGGFAIEVKRVEAGWLEAWWTQASEQADSCGLLPVVIHRKSGAKWKAVLMTEFGSKRGGRVHVRSSVDLDSFMQILLSQLTFNNTSV